MEAVVAAARRADAWILADEVLILRQCSLNPLQVVLLLGSAELSRLFAVGGDLE